MIDSTTAKIVRRQEGGPGRGGGQKIENHYMGDCTNVDMFYRTECDPEIDSEWLENRFCTFRQLGKAI